MHWSASCLAGLSFGDTLSSYQLRLNFIKFFHFYFREISVIEHCFELDAKGGKNKEIHYFTFKILKFSSFNSLEPNILFLPRRIYDYIRNSVYDEV